MRTVVNDTAITGMNAWVWLTATSMGMVACIRPVQDQGSQNASMDEEA